MSSHTDKWIGNLQVTFTSSQLSMLNKKPRQQSTMLLVRAMNKTCHLFSEKGTSPTENSQLSK